MEENCGNDTVKLPYTTEYARSNHSECRKCNAKIGLNMLRLGETLQGRTFRELQDWYHYECFFQIKHPTTIGDIADFRKLRYEDQKRIKEMIEGDPSQNIQKKMKLGDEAEQCNQEELLEQQQNEYYELLDILQCNKIKREHLKEILQANQQPDSYENIKDAKERVCDILTFGALEKCPHCSFKKLVFKDFRYVCKARVTGSVKCLKETDYPTRYLATIPDHIKNKYWFFQNFEPKVRDRVIIYVPPSVETLKQTKLKTGLPEVTGTNAGSSVNMKEVDPLSNLSNVHVYIDYQRGGLLYSAMLIKVNIQDAQNQFIKLQILESDDKKSYWIFKSWGRVGGESDGSTKPKNTFEEAEEKFGIDFYNHTGIPWEMSNEVKPIPGNYYYIKSEEEVDEKNVQWDIGKKSELEEPVQELVKMLFDKNQMRSYMLQMKIDVEKMPLGRISRKKIQEGFQVLVEILDLIEKNAPDYKFVDRSNAFFALVPHNFGYNFIPTIKTKKQIEDLCDNLNCLLEIEEAYSILACGDCKNPIDYHYNKLNTKICTLDKNSPTGKTIEEYVKNTHGSTHDNFELEIEEIFTIRRENEKKRYEPFKDLHNRKLLWHGSQQINFAGILSHGLKIAPPDIPATGYMFGKGIYFTDTVSKAANYCRTSRQNTKGLLLLCEVALGEMLHLTKAEYIEKLPENKHSVKGCGIAFPNPLNSIFSECGVNIPLGKINPVDLRFKSPQQQLLYNEYIVFDPAQVNCQYLLNVNFKYK